MDIPFPVGTSPATGGPLAHFLPPLPVGSTRQALALGAPDLPPGALAVDPFGVCPQLAMEAARAGLAVLVASSNPVTRLVLERTIRPWPLKTLRAALAHLAAAPKDATRLEPFLLDLYRTTCSRCRSPVSADYFVWDREADRVVLKAYACGNCGHAAEEPADRDDQEIALSFGRRGLQHALALEQVAPAGDPDRAHAEAALGVYPGRALYALITLANKVEQLDVDPDLKSAAGALLLSAMDSAAALWGHPEGRTRPRQLVASPRFREANVWRSLERAVDAWAMPDPGVNWRRWSGSGRPAAGEIAIFPGPVRELLETLAPAEADLLLTVFPRPNQAYWTLSALWASWVWGREVATPIKVALRRRRYDWAWHAAALRGAMAGFSGRVRPETSVVGFVAEAEPGFVAAVLGGMDGAGFRLTARVLRADEDLALFIWRSGPAALPEVHRPGLERRVRSAVSKVLAVRAEPTPYALLHLSAWGDLAGERQIAPLWRADADHPLVVIGQVLEEALADGELVERLDQRVELETGVFWLADAEGSGPPLADQVEEAILQILRAGDEMTLEDLDRRLCRDFPGLRTPDQHLIRACLVSYGHVPAGEGGWRLRPEDEQAARAGDMSEMAELLRGLGAGLGFSVDQQGRSLWFDGPGKRRFQFLIQESAFIHPVLSAAPEGTWRAVVPGGRAALVVEKARRDPRLAAWLRPGGRAIKYRHVRRLADDTTVTAENLEERLAIDPPEHQDPQMPLL